MKKIVKFEDGRNLARPESVLTPELKAFIDGVIVPVLVQQYVADENHVADGPFVVAQSSGTTATLQSEEVRP